jgi:diacylglycerol kinase
MESIAVAARGLLTLVRSERNARIHLLLAVLALGLSFFLRISALEWVAVVLCIGGVFTAEALNTAVEVVVDLVQPEHHPLAGLAKDYAAGAVLVAACSAAVAGAVIFLPRIIAWFL